MEIVRLPVLRDNYVFLLIEPAGSRAAVVDPAVAEPVAALAEATDDMDEARELAARKRRAEAEEQALLKRTHLRHL